MRIIAGTARGRKIDAPEGRETRPTLDRVKESVFGSIQFEIAGREVLDLFAGSGNMGIEALSRGAAHADFCDNSARCCDLIKKNLGKTGFENGAVFNCGYESMIAMMKQKSVRYGLVFLDPPYASGLAQEAHYMLCESDLLTDDAIIVAEHSAEQEISAHDMLLISSRKRYGDTAVTILRRNVSNRQI